MENLVVNRYYHQILGNVARITYHGIAKNWLDVYGSTFKFSNNKWYESKNGKWFEIQHDSYMMVNLRSTLTYDTVKFLTTVANSITTTSNKKMVANQLAFAANIFSHIDNDRFMNGVLRECSELAYENEVDPFCKTIGAKL